ncbi:MAG: EAL domain-containing protein [Pseudomonadota bacterium]
MAIIRRYQIRFGAIFLLAFSAWILGGEALHDGISSHNNRLQLEDVSHQLIRRSEKAIDFVVIANSEFLVAGHSACDDAARNMLRQLVIDTGTVSDVYMVTPTGVCSSFDQLSNPLPAASERATWVEARNPAYRIGKIDGHNSHLIGVSWGFGTDLELVAAISADAILFDVLPNELRSTGRVGLSIDEMLIADFVGAQAQERDASDWTSFTAMGSRYPLKADILVASEALSSWRATVSVPIMLGWLALGSAVAGLSAWAASGGRNRHVADVVYALENNEIGPHFQPIVDLQTTTVIGCEALARWTKPDGEHISPGRFIPLIEQHGLNDKLLKIMVEKAAVGLREALQNDPDFYVSFNVTPDQLCRPGFAKVLTDLVEDNGLAPKQVCIEITERQEITSPENAASATAILREAGFRVAIDDAGTGHNGLAAIQMLDASVLKIDKFFIDHIAHDTRSTVMVDMLVSMAKRYGMKTVAEGVETQEQAEILQHAGVDSIQGFFYSRPVSAGDFLAALNTHWQHFGEPKTNHAADEKPAPMTSLAATSPVIQVGVAASA